MPQKQDEKRPSIRPVRGGALRVDFGNIQQALVSGLAVAGFAIRAELVTHCEMQIEHCSLRLAAVRFDSEGDFAEHGCAPVVEVGFDVDVTYPAALETMTGAIGFYLKPLAKRIASHIVDRSNAYVNSENRLPVAVCQGMSSHGNR